MRLDESRAEVTDHTEQRMTGVKACLGRQADDSIGGLHLDHGGVHDVLGWVIYPDEQAVPGAPDEDPLAADAEKPTPVRPQLLGHLERSLGLAGEL